MFMALLNEAAILMTRQFNGAAGIVVASERSFGARLEVAGRIQDRGFELFNGALKLGAAVQ